MASTLTPAPLNVTIREQITMNGTDYGGITRYTVNNISEISRRLVTTNGTSSTEVIRFQPSASAGQFINTDVRYLRITNLDDTNFATLRFQGSASTDYSFRLDPTGSFLLMTTQDSGSTNAGVTNLRTIKVVASGSAVDLELFVASE